MGRLELSSMDVDAEVSIVTFIAAVIMELWNKIMAKSMTPGPLLKPAVPAQIIRKKKQI